MITALCFDLDGTLARYGRDFGGWVDGLRADLGLLHCDMNGFGPRLIAALRHDGPVTLGSALERALAGLGVAPVGLDEVVGRALARYAAGVELLPGAADLLEAARGRRLPMAIVSNGPEDMQRAALRALGIADLFAAVVISGDPAVGARKPAARPFELAVAALGRPPAEALMIGDDLAADVQGALAAGLQALRIGGPEGPGYAALPDLASVPEWLASRGR